MKVRILACKKATLVLPPYRLTTGCRA
jgi:hypothetical protein